MNIQDRFSCFKDPLLGKGRRQRNSPLDTSSVPGAGLEDENPPMGTGAGARYQSSSESWKGKLRTEPGTEPQALKMAQGDDKDVDHNGGAQEAGNESARDQVCARDREIKFTQAHVAGLSAPGARGPAQPP